MFWLSAYQKFYLMQVWHCRILNVESTIAKSNHTNKTVFFKALAVLVLLYGCLSWRKKKKTREEVDVV